MKQKTNSVALKIVLKILSVVLAVLFVLSTLGAVAVTGVRHFFGDGEFEKTVSETDLNEVKFTSNGKTYTASDYIYEAVTNAMPSAVKNYSNIMNSVFGGNINSAIKEIISSETVDAVVKSAMMECVDYYLNSDAKEAKMRLKGEIVYDIANPYKEVKTPEEAIRIYVRSFIKNTVENTSGMQSDQIIVLLSKNTANTLTAAAVISAVMIIICNLGCIFDLLLHFGGASLIFGITVKILQGKFESSQTDKTLIGYKMLEPFVDSFSPNAAAGIIIGILLIAAFFGLFMFYKSKNKAKETENIK